MNNLDKLGVALKERVTTFASQKDGLETERQSIGSDLRKIWTAFADAKKNKIEIEINGCKSKSEYAAFLEVDIRYCQYLVKDGSRKGQKTTRTTSSPLDGVGYVLEGVTLDDNGARAYIGFGKEETILRTAKYSERRSGEWTGDTFPKLADGETPDPNAIVNWRYTHQPVDGDLHIKVYLPGASIEELLKALIERSRVTLRALHIKQPKPHKEIAVLLKESFAAGEYEDHRTPAPKVKKLTPGQTAKVIAAMAQGYETRPDTRDDASREWAERYLQSFEEQAKQHPEWRNQQIQTERRRIEYLIDQRGYAEPEEVESTNKPKERKPAAQLNKKERQAYAELKKKLDSWTKQFDDGKIGAVEWRNSVTILENTSISRAIFHKRSGRFMDYMKQVRERMEVAIKDVETRQEMHPAAEALAATMGGTEDETEGFQLAAQLSKCEETL